MSFTGFTSASQQDLQSSVGKQQVLGVIITNSAKEEFWPVGKEIRATRLRVRVFLSHFPGFLFGR
jgi:hypothetical protein